ncbi:carbamoyl-phosphate synthase small subunit [Paraburkholderia youngii]
MLPSFSPALLALADGTVFRGYSIGAPGHTIGEVVFNTAITGYQEILTDPSYARQIVTLTYPHIGNVGVNAEDVEATKVHAAGLIIRDLPVLASNFRMERTLPQYLQDEGVVAIAGIDTRKLTRLLRDKGAQNGAILAGSDDEAKAIELARSFPGLAGMDLAKVVSTPETYEWTKTEWRLGTGYGEQKAPKYRVVAFDYGVKQNILRMLAERGCHVTVLPAQASAADALALNPDGVFLSNGPGDPEPCDYAIAATKEFIERGIPTFGICPWPPDHGPCGRRKDDEDEDRPPRRESPSQGSRRRPRGDHVAEPRLRGRCRHTARQRARDPRIVVRRHAAGLCADRQAGVLLPGPPGSVARSERHRVSVRSLHRVDERAEERQERSGLKH